MNYEHDVKLFEEIINNSEFVKFDNENMPSQDGNTVQNIEIADESNETQGSKTFFSFRFTTGVCAILGVLQARETLICFMYSHGIFRECLYPVQIKQQVDLRYLNGYFNYFIKNNTLDGCFNCLRC
jgi:hypothetical protein